MQDGLEAQIKSQLNTEIAAMQTSYQTIQAYLAGAEYDKLEVVGAVQAFKNSLGRVSTHVMAFYQLKGQKTKITWQPLLDNLETALENIKSSRNAQPRGAVQLALDMSEPSIAEVMSFLEKLQKSLS